MNAIIMDWSANIVIAAEKAIHVTGAFHRIKFFFLEFSLNFTHIANAHLIYKTMFQCHAL